MAATIGQKHKNGFKIVEIWDNHSESLKNNLYNDFKGPEHLLGGMNLENEIDTCQTTVQQWLNLVVKSYPSSKTEAIQVTATRLLKKQHSIKSMHQKIRIRIQWVFRRSRRVTRRNSKLGEDFG